MKIRIDDIVYLQKYEVTYIMHEVDNVPGSVLKECFGGGEDGCFFMRDLGDGFRFDCAFKTHIMSIG